MRVNSQVIFISPERRPIKHYAWGAELIPIVWVHGDIGGLYNDG
jgi:hypothetical protein